MEVGYFVRKGLMCTQSYCTIIFLTLNVAFEQDISSVAHRTAQLDEIRGLEL